MTSPPESLISYKRKYSLTNQHDLRFHIPTFSRLCHKNYVRGLNLPTVKIYIKTLHNMVKTHNMLGVMHLHKRFEKRVLMKRFFLPIIVILIFLLSGCIKTPDTIKDLRELKQDHMFYIDKSASNREMVTSHDQKRMDAHYNTLYFAPWHQTAHSYPLDSVTATFQKFGKNPGYGENGRKHKKSWIRNLRANAQLDHYPNAGVWAISIDNTDLRVLPTHKPYFSNFNHTQRGYPFDKFQESIVAANTPLFISHVTKDKVWVLAETPYATGWIPIRNVAFVDTNFIKTWARGQYAVIIKDKTPVYDDAGQFLFIASLGSLFPEVEKSMDSVKVLVAVADMNRKAVIKTTSVSKETAVSKPLKLSPFNIAKVANELINEPYGWGGLYQNRDCSAMMKDMFAPFGIWLPRHSADQARKGGAFIDLENLSPEERETMILKQGIPYLTLLWRKGHIMLYIGSHEGKILVFHNFWGIRTRDWLGRQGRKIVGHAAITTLQPGIELYDIDPPQGNYLNHVLGMTLLINPLNQGGPKQ
jgi:cell wall-associated NlpC family hydrolase